MESVLLFRVQALSISEALEENRGFCKTVKGWEKEERLSYKQKELEVN